MSDILHIPQKDKLNAVGPTLKARIIEAQQELIEMEFRSSGAFLERIFDDLKLKLTPPRGALRQPVNAIADQSFRDLGIYFSKLLGNHGIPDHSIGRQAAALSHRAQLLRAFRDPDKVVRDTVEKVAEIISGFPRTPEEIQCGKNPGDVLDPYILAATQQLVYGGDLANTFNATVAHKILMMIEGLMGHLHEDVIGAMRGNVRVPEPRGDDQETLNPKENPFPGADIVQPPIAGVRPIRFHQLKSKTGSAKGGDGARLGNQLVELQKFYGGEVFYDALIGNTLRGHRSMAGVLRAAPNVVVLVGESAFLALTGTSIGPELLLRLYQAAFDVSAKQSGYKLQDVVKIVYEAFNERAKKSGDTFMDSILHDAISGSPEEQDSRQFKSGRRK